MGEEDTTKNKINFEETNNSLMDLLIDENLEKLESKINEFNPLKILKIEDFEIRHSNVLAWLLNPKENHGLGDKVLKKFILNLIRQNNFNKEIKEEINVSSLENYSFLDIKVFREWNHIDILLVSDKLKLVIFIENKFLSKESKNQLNKYKEVINKKYLDYKILPVYMTLYEEEPSDKDYGIFRYDTFYMLLNSIVELNKENINSNIYNFLYNYLKILKEFTMEDKEIINLCKNIYQNHKEAIDLIIEYGIDDSFYPSMEKFIRESSDLEYLGNKYNRVWFLPKDICETTPKDTSNNWAVGYPISFWFYRKSKDNKLGIALEVGPFKDPKKRIQFINFLKNNGFTDISSKLLITEGFYTRIYSKYTKFENWDSEEELLKTANELWTNADEIRKKIILAVNKFDWK